MKGTIVILLFAAFALPGRAQLQTVIENGNASTNRLRITGAGAGPGLVGTATEVGYEPGWNGGNGTNGVGFIQVYNPTTSKYRSLALVGGDEDMSGSGSYSTLKLSYGKKVWEGNMGIGTYSPDYKLTIQRSSQLLSLRSTSATVAAPIADFNDDGRGVETVISSTDGTTDGSYFASYTNKPLLFGANATSAPTAKMAILPNGNIGIGTNLPQEKLAVNGTVLAKEVRVSIASGDWPDYVFAPGYDLPKLSDVGAYIAANKHLPGIPAAAEAEKNGVALGDMNAKLLKKLEEVTLYLLELKKENTELAAKVAALSKEAEQARK